MIPVELYGVNAERCERLYDVLLLWLTAWKTTTRTAKSSTLLRKATS